MTYSEILAMIPSAVRDTPLCDLPDAAFYRGSYIYDVTRALGYDESACTIINQQRAWGLTVREWAENMADVATAEARKDEPTTPLG